jgi:hypothetical protein
MIEPYTEGWMLPCEAINIGNYGILPEFLKNEPQSGFSIMAESYPTENGTLESGMNVLSEIIATTATSLLDGFNNMLVKNKIKKARQRMNACRVYQKLKR